MKIGADKSRSTNLIISNSLRALGNMSKPIDMLHIPTINETQCWKKIAFRNNQDKYALHISRSSWSRNKSIPNQQEEHTSIQQQQKQEPGRTLTPGSSFCRWRLQRRGWRHREGQVVLATRGSQQRRARNLFYSLTSNPRYNFPFLLHYNFVCKLVDV